MASDRFRESPHFRDMASILSREGAAERPSPAVPAQRHPFEIVDRADGSAAENLDALLGAARVDPIELLSIRNIAGFADLPNATAKTTTQHRLYECPGYANGSLLVADQDVPPDDRPESSAEEVLTDAGRTRAVTTRVGDATRSTVLT